MNTLEYRGLDNISPIVPLDTEEARLLMVMSSCYAYLDWPTTRFTVPYLMQQAKDSGHLPMLVMLKRVDVLLRDKFPDDPNRAFRLADAPTFMYVAGLRAFQTPGIAVMWAYTLLLWAAERGKPLTLHNFVEDYYPMGVPNKEAYDKAWDAQKIGGCNRLDDGALWQPWIDKLKSTTNSAETAAKGD